MKGAVAFTAALLTVAACGGTGGPSSSTSPSPSPAIATPPPTPTPPALIFKLNGVNSSASGTIKVTTASGSVTLLLVITGLQPNSSHVSHIHVGSCEQKGAILFALNQVVADGQGDATVPTTIDAKYPPATSKWYVVVHAGPDMQGSNATYLLCGNLFT